MMFMMDTSPTQDDLTGEAKELHAIGNGWFAYTPLLHRIREGAIGWMCTG
jgi:hypothetical protein